MKTRYAKSDDAPAVADAPPETSSVEDTEKEVYMSLTEYKFHAVKACRIDWDDNKSARDGGREQWVLTIPLAELPQGWQYGPNARYAKADAKPVQAMLETLQSEPEWFSYRNNGITLVAESLEARSSPGKSGHTVKLTMREFDPEDPDATVDGHGHGVVNGGHTYLALCTALQNAGEYAAAMQVATVFVRVEIGIPDEQLTAISQAQNTMQPVPLHALRELSGDWDVIKVYLPDATMKLVSFKPNDPETQGAPYDVTDLVRRMVVMDDRLYPMADGKHPRQAYSGVGALVRRYSVEHFAPLAPLLSDFLKLEELIVQHYEAVNGMPAKSRGALGVLSKVSGCSGRKQTLLTGYEASMTIAEPFVLPVLAAFRIFIRPDLSGWVRPLGELWETYGPKVVSALWEQYKETGKSSSSNFGRQTSTWAAAAHVTERAALQNGWMKLDDSELPYVHTPADWEVAHARGDGEVANA